MSETFEWDDEIKYIILVSVLFELYDMVSRYFHFKSLLIEQFNILTTVFYHFSIINEFQSISAGHQINNLPG